MGGRGIIWLLVVGLIAGWLAGIFTPLFHLLFRRAAEPWFHGETAAST